MIVIGLCGGSGSGKGCVCEAFSELGIPSIDTDALYRDMTSGDSPCVRALRAAFGEGIANDGGGLDRGYLRKLVFDSSDAEKNRALLNSITHKYILDEVREIIERRAKEGLPAIIVDAPLLFESEFHSECDTTLCVTADRDIRISRIVSRDGISERNAELRIDSQISDEELIGRCDYHIINNGDLSDLKKSVYEVYKKLI